MTPCQTVTQDWKLPVGFKLFSYTELTLNQQLTYDILENYFQLQLDMADMYLYDELLRPSTGVQAQLPILYEEYSFNSKKTWKII